MSTKTASQMEAVLMDKIQKAQVKLDLLQQKHQLEIGKLAYKHGLQNLTKDQLNLSFAKIAAEAKIGLP